MANDFTGLILPLTKNICRTCLLESDSALSVQDLIEHDTSKIKLIDILVFLNCLENNDEDNWPQGMCGSCVSTALLAYNFKLRCLKANMTLSRIFTIQASPTHMQRSDMDSIDINVVYQDHEYDVPLFSNHNSLNFVTEEPENKELTPLPSVTEIISKKQQPPPKEGEKHYSCNVCFKNFTRLHGLRYHMTRHSDIRKYLCPKCGKCFHTSSGLRQHLLSHKVAQFKCGFCNKTYKSRQSLKEHFRVAHSSNRKLFVCGTCGKRFTAKSTLINHSHVHNGEKKYACLLCPKTYTRAAYLRVHSIVHSGEQKPKPFSCSQSGCDRSFTTKHSLKVHIAHSHSSERPHICSICTKGFATKPGLKAHLESHSSSEVFCSICDRKFANKRVLQKHMKVHDVDANDMILETVVDSIFYDEVPLLTNCDINQC